MRKPFLITFTLLICILGYSQEEQLLLKGAIVDSIKIANTVNESYAIYLPAQYDKKIPSAIVFVFDPAARGKVGIEPFVLAAETYNYILVCSNNSKNGPYDINLGIANRLFDSVLGFYNVAPSQLYISGFSGGSRLAGSIAVSSGAFQGVIACGASFNVMDKYVLQGNGFSYVGMVGDRDMNYQEMIENQVWLDKMKIRNTLFVSQKDHSWPKQKEMLRAFDWLEIEAFKKNIRKSNDTIILNIYSKNLAIADSLKNANEYLLAVKEYESINSSFDSKFNSDSNKKMVVELKKSKEYKTELKKYQEITLLENEIAQKFMKRFEDDDITNKEINFTFWKTEFKKLEQISIKYNTIQIRDMVSRLISLVKALAYEKEFICKSNGDTVKLDYYKKLLEMISLELKTSK
ncbi:hypothetical protein [Flavobacterium sp.]|uniref:hypothetical protein n=1 Tax=Flavobacterium sp. TaxID=239 RepID=UPI0037534253